MRELRRASRRVYLTFSHVWVRDAPCSRGSRAGGDGQVEGCRDGRATRHRGPDRLQNKETWKRRSRRHADAWTQRFSRCSLRSHRDGEQHAAGAKRVASPGLPPAVQVGRPPRLIGWPARTRPLKASASPPPSGSCHPNSSSLLSASPSNIPPIKIAASFSSSSHFISLARHRRVAWRRVVSDLVLFFPLVFLFFAAFLLFLSTTPPPAFPLSRRLALVSLWVRELFESRFSAINSATRIYPAVVAAHDPYFLSSIVSS
ncbi:hypothetical protein M432DRAFT_254934 [Thermoascus aurantiacus ATCC 26904]